MKRSSKVAKVARKRNFRLYRLSGMLRNLAQMRYEMRNNALAISLIEDAMDAVHEFKTYIKDGEPVTPQISSNKVSFCMGWGENFLEPTPPKEQ